MGKPIDYTPSNAILPKLAIVDLRHPPACSARTETNMTQKTFLHVGCGPVRRAGTLAAFVEEDWREITVDIDPRVKPDIVDALPALSQVPAASCDAVFSSHTLEHLYAHDVAAAAASFLRVLRPGGFVVAVTPDLQAVSSHLALGDLDTPLYDTPVGPVTPLDILFGHRAFTASGNHFMAHRTGFTRFSITKIFRKAGYAASASICRDYRFDLVTMAFPENRSEDEIRILMKQYSRPASFAQAT
jgi:SAM-dependent methyltransferase